MREQELPHKQSRRDVLKTAGMVAGGLMVLGATYKGAEQLVEDDIVRERNKSAGLPPFVSVEKTPTVDRSTFSPEDRARLDIALQDEITSQEESARILYDAAISEELRTGYDLIFDPLSLDELDSLRNNQDIQTGVIAHFSRRGKLANRDKFLSLMFRKDIREDIPSSLSLHVFPPYNVEDPVASSIPEVRGFLNSVEEYGVYPEGEIDKDHIIDFTDTLVGDGMETGKVEYFEKVGMIYNFTKQTDLGNLNIQATKNSLVVEQPL